MLNYRYCPLCAGLLREDRNPVSGFERPTCVQCGWVFYPANPIGVLVVVEHHPGIVLVHPAVGAPEAPASLPGTFAEYGETPEMAAVRSVREVTGLDVEVGPEFTRFQQPGTPFGLALIFGFVGKVVGGALRDDGHDGPAVAYPLAEMPPIIPVRAANLRVLATYLERVGKD